MREILFRGKTISGEWVVGHYFYDPRPYGGHFILRHHAYSEDATEVIPSTIGQFTGLHDRDGKRIFEGDVMDTGVVIFDKGAFVGHYYEGEFGEDDFSTAEQWEEPLHTRTKKSTIIGNIHQS